MLHILVKLCPAGPVGPALCYADSKAVQTKYFHNYSQEPKGHLKQAIKKTITIISIIITHHFNRMAAIPVILWCLMVYKRRKTPS